jgi:hypothetical protein
VSTTTVTTTTASTTTATVTSATIAIGAETTAGATTGAKEKTAAELKYDELEVIFLQETERLVMCQNSNTTEDNCAVELQSVETAQAMMAAQADLVAAEASKITTAAPSIAQQGDTGTAIVVAAVVVVLAVLVGAVVVVRARNKHAGGAHPAVRTRFTFASHSCFVLFQFGMEEYSLSFVEKGEGCLLE